MILNAENFQRQTVHSGNSSFSFWKILTAVQSTQIFTEVLNSSFKENTK